MAIGELTGHLKMLNVSGPTDLQLSEATRDKYLALVHEYRDALVKQRNRVPLLGNLGIAGGYRSAIDTKERLEQNATGLDGIYNTLGDYIEYLNVFADTVNAAFRRMQVEDQK